MRKSVVTYCLILLFSILDTRVCCQSQGLLNDPVLPDSILNDRHLSYQYYKNHFWDNCQLNDSSLYGNQAYANRIDAFFDKVVAPLPDSIKLEIDRFLAKIQNKVIKDFTLLYLLNKYEHPMYMTHDEIFIHLADEYILKNRDNALLNEAAYFFIEAHSGDLKRLALFNEAPALSLPDKNGLYIDTQSLESDYLILFFYDHECDVCAGEAQTLETICREHQNVSVYAVDMNYDFQPFENSFINVSAFHSRGLDPTDAYCIENTPLIYVLDREKSIIAKKIKAEQIGLFLK